MRFARKFVKFCARAGYAVAAGSVLGMGLMLWFFLSRPQWNEVLPPKM